MDRLIVTTDETGLITIDFGIYFDAGIVPFSMAHYKKGYGIKSHLMADHILIWGNDMRTFEIVAPNGNEKKGLIVQSINGIIPTDLEHLFEMIKIVF